MDRGLIDSFDIQSKSAFRNFKSAILLCAMLFALCSSASAQQPKPYRIGVLLPGEQWHEIVDGLRSVLGSWGLKRGNSLFSQLEIGRVTRRWRRRQRGNLNKRRSA